MMKISEEKGRKWCKSRHHKMIHELAFSTLDYCFMNQMLSEMNLK